MVICGIFLGFSYEDSVFGIEEFIEVFSELISVEVLITLVVMLAVIGEAFESHTESFFIGMTVIDE